MPIRYSLLDSTGRLAPHAASIKEAVEAALDVIHTYFECDIDVCISYFPGGTNPDLGIGGGSFSPHLLNIFLDTENPKVAHSINAEMLAVLAHEVHHCVRCDRLGTDTTLRDYLATEGLACCFEAELTNSSAPSFIPEELIRLWEDFYLDMEPYLEDCQFDFDTLFLGKSPHRFPRYAGYAVGFGLARKYTVEARHSAATAVHIASDAIIPGP